jgi:hypothetical protein
MTERRKIQGTAPTRKDLARLVLKLRARFIAASGMLAMRKVDNRSSDRSLFLPVSFVLAVIVFAV